MRKYMRPILSALRILAGVLLLVISVRGVDWNELIGSLGAASPTWTLLAFLSILFGLALKAWRWTGLLKNFGLSVGFHRVAEALLAGQAANIVLPARGGEVVRLGLLAADDLTKSGPVLASIALEKFFDLIALTITALLSAAYLPLESASWVRGVLLPVSILATVVVVVVIIWGPNLWKVFQRVIPTEGHPRIHKIVLQVDRLVESSLWVRDIGRVLPSALLTILIWAVMGTTNLLLFSSLGITAGIPGGGLVLVLVHIGLLPALMPGNIGPFYFFAQLALRAFAVPTEAGVAFSILLHALVTLPPLIIGGVMLLLSGKPLFSTKSSHI